MHFLIVGVDGPDFGADGEVETDLHESHWAYMDRWADVLVARGPTLTPDGESHAGSLHVVDVPDLAAATRFAFEEPYAQAGWYAEVTVNPLEPCVTGTMWDRPAPASGQPSSLGRASFEARPRGGRPRVEVAPSWVYLGLILTDDASTETGLVGLIDLAPDEASRRLHDTAAALDVSSVRVTSQRWQRGGRHQS